MTGLIAIHDAPVKPSERNFARRIDLTSLQLFVAVCELGSIGKAAEREFIAASAVSKRLADLEARWTPPALPPHARRRSDARRRKPAAPRPLGAVWPGEDAGRAQRIRRRRARPRAGARQHLGRGAVPAGRPGPLHAPAPAGQDRPRRTPVQRGGMRAVQEGAADLGICNTGSVGAPPAGHELQVHCPTAARPFGMLIVPRSHALSAQAAINFIDSLASTTSACRPTAPSPWPCTRRRPRPGARFGCASA
jgi:hypothetical protein